MLLGWRPASVSETLVGIPPWDWRRIPPSSVHIILHHAIIFFFKIHIKQKREELMFTYIISSLPPKLSSLAASGVNQ